MIPFVLPAATAALAVTRRAWREEERLAAGADIDSLPQPFVSWVQTSTPHPATPGDRVLVIAGEMCWKCGAHLPGIEVPPWEPICDKCYREVRYSGEHIRNVSGPTFGPFKAFGDGPEGWFLEHHAYGHTGAPDHIDLHPGMVVGSATVTTANVPIVDRDTGIRCPHYIYVLNDHEVFEAVIDRNPVLLDISGQIIDPTVGSFATQLTDAMPTTERCPECWGAEFGPTDEWWNGALSKGFEVCPRCDGAGRCEPYPWPATTQGDEEG